MVDLMACFTCHRVGRLVWQQVIDSSFGRQVKTWFSFSQKLTNPPLKRSPDRAHVFDGCFPEVSGGTH